MKANWKDRREERKKKSLLEWKWERERRTESVFGKYQIQTSSTYPQ